MKGFGIALALLFASVAAVPQDVNQARFVDGIVTGLINDLSNDIKDRGLDPYVRKHDTFDFRLPVTDLLVVEAALENFYFKGLSNIVVNRVTFGILTQRLDFDIELPRLSFRVGSSAASVKLFDKETSGYLSGSLDILGVRVRGRAQVRVSIISGIGINGLTINFTLKDIKSNLKVVVHQKDLSYKVNWALGEYIPYVIYSASDDINRLLEHVVLELINEHL